MPRLNLGEQRIQRIGPYERGVEATVFESFSISEQKTARQELVQILQTTVCAREILGQNYVRIVVNRYVSSIVLSKSVA